MSRIKRPYVVLEYDSVSTQAVLSTARQTVDISYKTVNFGQPSTTVWLVFLIIFLVVAAIVSFMRAYSWFILYPSNVPRDAVASRSSKLFWSAVWVTTETFGLCLTAFLVVLTSYVFVFYKWPKEEVFLLLPSESDYPGVYRAFYVVFGVTCGLVLLSNLLAILRQTQGDIFFIDWEQSRFPSKRLTSSLWVQSVWRTLLVANEYNELTVARWVFFDITIFFMGFLLV